MSHILIIDDDIHINEMLEEVLIQEGYQVSHAYSGRGITVSGKRKAGSDFIGFDAAGAYRRGSAVAD